MRRQHIGLVGAVLGLLVLGGGAASGQSLEPLGSRLESVGVWGKKAGHFFPANWSTLLTKGLPGWQTGATGNGLTFNSPTIYSTAGPADSRHSLILVAGPGTVVGPPFDLTADLTLDVADGEFEAGVALFGQTGAQDPVREPAIIAIVQRSYWTSADVTFFGGGTVGYQTHLVLGIDPGGPNLDDRSFPGIPLLDGKGAPLDLANTTLTIKVESVGTTGVKGSVSIWRAGTLLGTWSTTGALPTRQTGPALALPVADYLPTVAVSLRHFRDDAMDVKVTTHVTGAFTGIRSTKSVDGDYLRGSGLRYTDAQSVAETFQTAMYLEPNNPEPVFLRGGLGKVSAVPQQNVHAALLRMYDENGAVVVDRFTAYTIADEAAFRAELQAAPAGIEIVAFFSDVYLYQGPGSPFVFSSPFSPMSKLRTLAFALPATEEGRELRALVAKLDGALEAGKTRKARKLLRKIAEEVSEGGEAKDDDHDDDHADEDADEGEDHDDDGLSLSAAQRAAWLDAVAAVRADLASGSQHDDEAGHDRKRDDGKRDDGDHDDGADTCGAPR